MNKQLLKITTPILIVSAILIGLYFLNYHRQSSQPTQNNSQQTNTSTTTKVQDSAIVTPQQLSPQDLLKAGVTYRDTELGYEFITPKDVEYFKSNDLPDIRMINLIYDTGSNPKWLTITIYPISVAYSNVTPSNLNLMSEIKAFLQSDS